MALINSPTRAFQAGRKARKQGALIDEFPAMPPELHEQFMLGWKLQNQLILNSSQKTRFLAREIQHHDLCDEILSNRHKRRIKIHLTDKSRKILNRMQRVSHLSVDQCMDIACDLLHGVTREIEVNRK